ncbi:hypothetical protein AXG93_1390s1090 [Marchantia polymorpha subsp. ruderalis]|uniref:Uncharacterized protein n=1 Tax=Marchantia polymorpha subsp. ruderalis TaxID=1480154 RepID=A0A176WAM7_MARPO|nr:hypothetical protein AXG93_1390s1090 [Marchantia polymorpha subsp. ruderalis]
MEPELLVLPTGGGATAAHQLIQEHIRAPCSAAHLSVRAAVFRRRHVLPFRQAMRTRPHVRLTNYSRVNLEVEDVDRGPGGSVHARARGLTESDEGTTWTGADEIKHLESGLTLLYRCWNLVGGARSSWGVTQSGVLAAPAKATAVDAGSQIGFLWWHAIRDQQETWRTIPESGMTVASFTQFADRVDSFFGRSRRMYPVAIHPRFCSQERSLQDWDNGARAGSAEGRTERADGRPFPRKDGRTSWSWS